MKTSRLFLNYLLGLCWTLAWAMGGAALAAAPANDNFDQAIEITTLDVAVDGDNTGATEETGEPKHFFDHTGHYNAGKSVWWKWTPTESGLAIVDTFGSDLANTILGAYTGNAVDQLTLVANNDDVDFDNLQSKVTFPCNLGVTYFFAVDGPRFPLPAPNKEGAIKIKVHQVPQAELPPNDNFANRMALTGSVLEVASHNNFSGKEVGEPIPLGASSATTTVWFAWTAPGDGEASFDVDQANIVLSLYTGTELENLQPFGSGNGVPTISSSAIVRGTTYFIQAGGQEGFTGTFNLSINGPPPPPAAQALQKEAGAPLQFQVVGEEDAVVLVQWTTNFVTWNDEQTVTLTGGQAAYIAENTSDPLRFYRLVKQ